MDRAKDSPGTVVRIADSIAVFFSDILDPLSERGERHLLSDMVAIAVCAVVCSAEGWVDVERFGHSKLKWQGVKGSLCLPAHWGVENSLHWAVDVSQNEDQRRVRTGHAAEKLSRLRSLALNLLRNETGVKAVR